MPQNEFRAARSRLRVLPGLLSYPGDVRGLVLGQMVNVTRWTTGVISSATYDPRADRTRCTVTVEEWI